MPPSQIIHQPIVRLALSLCGAVFVFSLSARAASSTAENASSALGDAKTSSGQLRLWYKQPATHWTEALPVGNGRLGAMVFGGIAEEQLELNDDTLWTGEPHQYQHEGAAKYLPEIRRLLAEGKQKEAEALAMKEFMSIPLGQTEYQPLGTMVMHFSGTAGASDYRRELDLDSATATVQYRVSDVHFTRRTFSSSPDQVLVEQLSADQPGRISFSLQLTSPHNDSKISVVDSKTVRLTGQVKKGALHFAAQFRVLIQGGHITANEKGITVDKADAVTLLVTTGTNYKNFRDVSGDPEAIVVKNSDAAAQHTPAELVERHLADYRALFRRVSIDLGTSPAADLPTDERLVRTDKLDDPQLAALYFQFGRYLLISSSRPGGQPANLQGIWNADTKPAWGSKYTTNINLEMNYWPAEVANLSECAEPLFKLFEDLVVSGRETARAEYAAHGWVLHHNTDLWRGTAPINNSNHGIWPTGGAWLCRHLWEHFQFTGDREFLAQRAYPVMKEAALFFIDYLVKDPKTGWLISGPSNSPEHGGLVMGPTMDHQIIRALFQSTADAASILGVDTELATKLRALYAQIAPNQVGKYGQLQEWMQDVDDRTDNHRHTSHLWAVFPGDEINPQTPKIFDAAKQSLIFRGDEGTGWSLGWKILFWARFLDGNHAHKMIMRQLNAVPATATSTKYTGGGGTYPNLFDAHPPFQIDGNFAATAGICEMLLQSQRRTDSSVDAVDPAFEVQLLPALPSAWAIGSIAGLRARGGFELDVTWRDGALTGVTIRSLLGRPLHIRYGNKTVNLNPAAGTTTRLDSELQPIK